MTRPVVAAPVENRARTCSDATGEWFEATCSGEYDTISRSAGRCCGGGASYCPAPQLCADPAAFDPAAPYAGPDCLSYITATFTQSMCAAAGCMVYGGSGSGSGSGSGLGGGYFCDSQLTGACASETATSNGTSMGCWDAIYAHFFLGDAHVLLPHEILRARSRAQTTCSSACSQQHRHLHAFRPVLTVRMHCSPL